MQTNGIVFFVEMCFCLKNVSNEFSEVDFWSWLLKLTPEVYSWSSEDDSWSWPRKSKPEVNCWIEFLKLTAKVHSWSSLANLTQNADSRAEKISYATSFRNLLIPFPSALFSCVEFCLLLCLVVNCFLMPLFALPLRCVIGLCVCLLCCNPNLHSVAVWKFATQILIMAAPPRRCQARFSPFDHLFVSGKFFVSAFFIKEEHSLRPVVFVSY